MYHKGLFNMKILLRFIQMLRMMKPCPKYRRLVDEIRQSDFVQTLNYENQDIINYVNENAGTNGNSISDITYIGDILTVEVFFLKISSN